MKKFYSALLITFLIIGCSKDDTINEIEEEEEIVNLAPNNFDIEIVNISHDGATINWNEAVDPESDIVTYDIYLNQALVIENITELTYQFNDLQELTNYSGKVIAKDTNNNETTITFTFQTEKYYLKYLKRYDYGQVNYGTVGYAPGSPYSMIKSDGQNYIVAGKSAFPNGNGYRFFVSKIDYDGNELWKKFYDYQVGDSWRFKIGKTSTGFILAGHHHVLNLDNEGNVLWYKKIESYDIADGSAEIQSVKQDAQGNIFLVGGRGSEDPQVQQEAVLTKLNNSGEIIWEKVFKSSFRSFFNDLIIDSSDQLIILGSAETSGTTMEEYIQGPSSVEQIDFWVIKTNNEGEKIWENTFGDGKYDFPNQIISTSDNSFVVVGYGASLFKIDNSGNLVWSNTVLSTYNPTFSISETSDNGFVTTGKFDFGNYGALAISKYDSNGNLEWEKSYQESFNYLSGYSILVEDDGGYRIAGSSSKNYYYNDEKPYLLIFKTDPLGNHE
ncbi:hypothetical protein GCM10022260_23340 [Gaetbulibacter aestuarii]|uniref:fibronectin type III domain-containing protein n=1 Tax=Gaetbulibacter aestuarii TaxID=1502358 RepID=UPI0031E31A76